MLAGFLQKQSLFFFAGEAAGFGSAKEAIAIAGDEVVEKIADKKRHKSKRINPTPTAQVPRNF